MSRLKDLSAEIPLGLRRADELLHLYGRWAKDRRRRMHCGSAEGRYSIPPNEDDREPREMLMSTPDALVCQRALSKVPDIYRVVLAVLYVPQRRPIEAQLRQLRIPPRVSQERHLDGLKMFWNQHIRG